MRCLSIACGCGPERVQGLLSILTMALVDRGVLSLDEPLPQFKYQDSTPNGGGGPVTIRKLLQFCSGLESLPPPNGFAPSKRFVRSHSAATWASLRDMVLAASEARPADGVALQAEDERAHDNHHIARRWCGVSVPYELQHLELSWGWALCAALQDAIAKHLASLRERSSIKDREGSEEFEFAVDALASSMGLDEPVAREALYPLLSRVLDCGKTVLKEHERANGLDGGHAHISKDEFRLGDCRVNDDVHSGGGSLVAELQLRRTTIGGVHFGGSGEWNKSAWLKAKSVSDASERSWHNGVHMLLPKWLRDTPTCLDPRALSQLDEMALPGMQGIVSARCLAQIYSGALCQTTQRNSEGRLSDVPCLSGRIAQELTNDGSETWTRSMVGRPVAVSLGQRAFDLRRRSVTPHTDDPNASSSRDAMFKFTTVPVIRRQTHVKGYGHEAFGGAGLVMAVPSEQIVISITTNMVGGEHGTDVNYARQMAETALMEISGLEVVDWQ